MRFKWSTTGAKRCARATTIAGVEAGEPDRARRGINWSRMHQHAAPDHPAPAQFWALLREYLGHAFSLFGAPAALAKKLWLSARDYTACAEWLRVCEALLRRLVLIEALALAEAETKQSGVRPSINSGSRLGRLALAVARLDQAHPPRRRAEPVKASAPDAARPSENSGSRLGEADCDEARRGAHAGGARFDVEHPERWRVSFDLGLRGAQPSPLPARAILAYAPGHADGLEPRLQQDLRASAPLARRLEALVRGFNQPQPLVRRAVRLLVAHADAARALAAPPRRRDRFKPGFREVALLSEVTLAALDDQALRRDSS